MSVPVLLYHQIAAPPERKAPYQGLFVHPDNFRKQMRALKFLGYKGLSVRDAGLTCEEKSKAKWS